MKLKYLLSQNYPKGFSGYISQRRWKKIYQYLSDNPDVDKSILFACLLNSDSGGTLVCGVKENHILFWTGKGTPDEIHIGDIFIANIRRTAADNTILELRYGIAPGFMEEVLWQPFAHCQEGKISRWQKWAAACLDHLRYTSGKTRYMSACIVDDQSLRAGRQLAQFLQKGNPALNVQIKE